MSFESLTNRGEYLSAHYLAEILPTTLKSSELFKRWTAAEKSGEQTPRTRLRGMRRTYFDAKAELTDDADFFDPDRLRKQHQEVLRAFGFEPTPQTITVERAGQEHEIPVAHAELGSGSGPGIVALDCGWAVDTEAAQDPDGAGRLLDPVTLPGNETITTGAKLASWLLAADDPKLRYVLILSGAVVTLADRAAWGEGRYLAVSLDTAYARNEDREYDVVAALFGADSLRPPAEGGAEPLAELVAGSRQHAVGVSSELREGLKVSVELIANEVLDRIRQAGYQPQQVMELEELAKELGREALRYLYRILFLLYAEARPELGVLPVNDPEYAAGYSLARVGDLVARRLAPSAEGGFHLYESLDLLFRMVNEGHRPRGGAEVAEKASEGEGLRFEPMRSDLFLPEKTKLIGRLIAEPGSDPDDPDVPKIDTRLRNKVLYEVLRRLMLTRGGKRRRGGFISYAQLGINQLGAVYEGLMSYTGFVATEQLYEVAKNGDPKDGSWMIPASKAEDYEDNVFVYREDPYTGVRSRVSYAPGAFVYRLAGRDRQTSASYYTPQSLTEVTVQLALKYRLDQDDTTTPARELLDWTICEPALGSGAFLNEAINQVAAEYLRRRQKELEVTLDPEEYHLELQRVKAYIALHNCYGVDLNRTAVELAEVSVWLNVMHAGLQAPWFGLHLRRGNSLIGCGRKTYAPAQLADKSWLTTAPAEKPFRDGRIDDGTIHHFLLPADGWGAVAGEKEARELAPAETEKLKKWRTAMKRTPSAKGKTSQVKRLQALAGRVEFLWDLVQQRLAISEREIRRDIAVWGADDLPPVTGAVPREQILDDLTAPGTPYWRLKTLMDVWCALWFWPLDKVGLIDGTDPAYPAAPVEVTHVTEEPAYDDLPVYETQDIFGNVKPQQMKLPTKPTGTRKVSRTEQLDRTVPLTNLDDWLTFAEALIGRADIPADSLVSEFSSLEDLSDYEDSLVGSMGMEPVYRLGARFPWLPSAESVADQQGFFHWELTFAQAFTNGGFDIQVGNPPWVRPRWVEGDVLAEYAPWFALEDKPPVETWRERKSAQLERFPIRADFTRQLTDNSGMVAFLTHPGIYPLLAGTQPDLYRAVVCQVWRHLGRSGTAGMIHPDTHFGGTKEGVLREAAYRHLRVHGGFINVGNWAFDDASRNIEFGVHIYGTPQQVCFQHLSRLYGAKVLPDSLDHDGSGAIPGQRYSGSWDLRPHKSRVIQVNGSTLQLWQELRGDADVHPERANLLQPITVQEERAVAALSAIEHRLREAKVRISSGYHESNGKKDGLIRWDQGKPDSLGDLVLQGPHFGIATPFAKQPRVPYRSNNDWNSVDLASLSSSFVPGANYVLAGVEAQTRAAQDSWNGSKYTEHYRLVWREMIAFNTERSLFVALIPPGPSHVHAVRSAVIQDVYTTALHAGFYSALLIDYLLRIIGRGHLDVTDFLSMPYADRSHPLASALLLRALRLNCLTDAYARLWAELYEPSWSHETGIGDRLGSEVLGEVTPSWNWHTPLRSDWARRAAMVEIDALVAVWLGIGIEELIAVLRARYPVLIDREDRMWFDANGRKLAADPYAFGYGQTKEHFEQLMRHLENPSQNSAPEGYVAPFYKADRESEYRKVHASFSGRMQLELSGAEKTSLGAKVAGRR